MACDGPVVSYMEGKLVGAVFCEYHKSHRFEVRFPEPLKKSHLTLRLETYCCRSLAPWVTNPRFPA